MQLGLLLAAAPLAACSPARTRDGRIEQEFDAAGVSSVILRAAAAETASAGPTSGLGSIVITGQPTGGAEGYHPADAAWRETPAAEWGLRFEARRFGATLVISSKNEIDYIHHHYTIADISLRFPAGVALVRQPRTLSGSGEADLAPP